MKRDTRFVDTLAVLESAVATGSGARALDALLGAWRVRRLPALTDAIEELSRRYEDVLPPIAGKTERTRYEQMLDLVTRKRAVDVARILGELPGASVIRAKDHLDRLAVMEPDPRVARALLEHVAARRYTLSNKVWAGIFRELRRHGDVRAREGLAALPLPKEGPEGAQTFLARTASVLEHLPAELAATEDELRRLAAVRDALPGLRLDLPENTPRAAPAGRDEAALFAEMLAAPDDDAVCLVLADLYLERGDPRGELIALQVKNERSEAPLAKDLKREKQLIKENLLALLGPLEPVVDRKTCRFGRGFLRHAAVKLKTAAQRRELSGHPLLSTLSSIETRDVALVLHPSMRLLREVSGLSWRSFIELAHGPPLPQIRRVEVVTTIADPGSLPLERLGGLPSLEEASFEAFGYDGTGRHWSWILGQGKGALGGLRLEIVTDFFHGGLGAALDDLDAHRDVPGLVMHLHPKAGGAREMTLEISRNDRGYKVVIRSAVYWFLFTSQVFDPLTRSDVDLEVHRPTRPSGDNFANSLATMRAQLGSRVTVVP